MSEDKKTYEVGYLLTSPEAERGIAGVLEQNKAEVVNVGKLAEIRLAYPIKKHQSALFGFAQFSAMPENIAPIKASLSLSNGVLRFLIIALTLLKSSAGQMAEQVKSEQPEIKNKEIKVPEILSNEALEKKLEEILK